MVVTVVTFLSRLTLEGSSGLLLAIALAGMVALFAWRARSLSGSGAAAATAVGAAALHAAWGWGLYLILWFVSASVLSRIGRAQKARRTAGIVEKGDRRDAWQVLANGGVFALGALATPYWSSLSGASLSPVIATAAAGALAAAGADTWATEFGTLAGGRPWSLRLRRRVPPGTSGAVTLAGSLAAVVGATLLAILAWRCRMVPAAAVPAVTLGAIAGSWIDTVTGAWWQLRRHCPRCDSDTEQDVHDCGTRTERVGGYGALDNDGVNLLCTVVGAVFAATIARTVRAG